MCIPSADHRLTIESVEPSAEVLDKFRWKPMKTRGQNEMFSHYLHINVYSLTWNTLDG